MNNELIAAIERFLSRAEVAGCAGAKAGKNEIESVNEKIGGVIPNWYIDLLTRYPLCGIEFQWQEYPEEDDFDGRSSVMWSRPSDVFDESYDAYPGYEIIDKGFFNVACDFDGMGDPYFIDSGAGDNPPLYRVYHEGAQGADIQVGEFDAGIAAPKLSEFFDKAIFEA